VSHVSFLLLDFSFLINFSLLIKVSSQSTRSLASKNSDALSKGAKSLALMSDRAVEAETDRYSTLQQ
jgi:hypothetical protein